MAHPTPPLASPDTPPAHPSRTPIGYAEDIHGLFNFYGGPPPGAGRSDYLSTYDNGAGSTGFAYFADPFDFSFDPAWLSFSGDAYSNPMYTFHPGTYAAKLYIYIEDAAPNVADLTLTVTPEAPTTSPSPNPAASSSSAPASSPPPPWPAANSSEPIKFPRFA